MNERETIVYHGTIKRNVEGILQDGFRVSQKDIEWLGKGIYFFAYPVHAEWWAKQEARRHGEYPAILEVGLKYRSDALLDLDDPKQFDEFNRFACDLARRLNKFLTLNLNQDRRKHGVICVIVIKNCTKKLELFLIHFHADQILNLFLHLIRGRSVLILRILFNLWMK